MSGFFHKIIEKLTGCCIIKNKLDINNNQKSFSYSNFFSKFIIVNFLNIFYIIGFICGSIFLFFVSKYLILDVIYHYDDIKNNKNEIRLFLTNGSYLTKENLNYPIIGKEVGKIQLKRNDNLFKALVKNGFDKQNVNDVFAVMYKKIDLRNLPENQNFYIEYDYKIYMEKVHYKNEKYNDLKPVLKKPLESKKITKLTFKLPKGAKYKVEKNKGGYILHVEKPTFVVKTHIVSGIINNNLFTDALVSDISATTLYNMLNEYAFLIDFQRDLHKGDKFIFVLETTRDSDGDFISEKVLYSNLILSGRKYEIFKYNGSFYDRDGKSIQKNLLKTPVDGARISSGFNLKRKHPILGYTKAHTGIDLAVPMGTPIYAAGDGVVVDIKLNHNAYGKYITIRHNKEYSTRYAHMSKVAHLRVGQFVKQRQVIGYVGMTGLATGPHLHYEVMRYGKHINPKNLKAVETKKLESSKLKDLKIQIQKIDEALNNSL